MSIDMGIRNLAEAVILQSIEDLWDKNHKSDCLAFFKGEGFRLASEMAGMSAADKLRLLLMLRRCGQKGTKVDKNQHRLRQVNE
jgi:hypothetical protein